MCFITCFWCIFLHVTEHGGLFKLFIPVGRMPERGVRPKIVDALLGLSLKVLLQSPVSPFAVLGEDE